MRIARWTPVTASSLGVAFVAATIAWTVLLVAAPFAASRPHASALSTALIAAVYGIGSLVCHQLPERSYFLWQAQLPVCARCTGIYCGAAAGAVAAALRRQRLRQPVTHGRHQPDAAHETPQRFAPERSPRLALALAVAPTLATLAYEWTTGDMPAHTIRAAAGVPIGFVAAWLIVAAANNQVN